MATLSLLCLVGVAYTLGLALVISLYFPPLAKFPSPKLAAVTSLYEAFYEIVLKGQYSRRMSKLHDIYGILLAVSSAVRFFDEFYVKSGNLAKEGWDKAFGSRGNIMTSVHAAVHQRRRAAVTPMIMLTIACFRIINTPEIYKRLHGEPAVAFPVQADIELLQCEQLPYLRARTMQACRLGYGLSATNPKTDPSQPVVYREWVIPAETCVAMMVSAVNHDEDVFPKSRMFVPERWLGSPVRGLGRRWRDLCLAWTELYLTLATMHRCYKFELIGPDVRDVQMAHDNFIAAVRMDAKGVRAFVNLSNH
ncbi:cytochrome P450 [Xylariomycetidae sp. FL2044]|nr:cytochrome P450 [Xylariomycetidae sp. FL2044]